MNYETLCLSLVNADKEEKVIEILKKAGYWDNEKYWRTFGDNENNYSTIGNQSASADSALVEKLVNSVDAMLMSKAFEQEDLPETKTTPQSINEAVEKYFNVKDGKLAYLDSRERSTLAENIYLVSTGKKNRPCYSIIDKGEGISPLNMPDTILSVSKSNKLRVPFVQGKFHMGGTGSLAFCGKHNLQLIISKRNHKILTGKNEIEGDWSFTIIRRFTPEKVRSSVYKYLAPLELKNEKCLLHFSAKSLPLLPGPYPVAYKEALNYGTFVKLYEYDFKGYKSLLTLDPYYRMSVLLPGIALPIRLAERRRLYRAHTYESTLSGLKVRLEEDRGEVVEEGFPTSHEITCLGEKMKLMVYAFKKGKAKNYRKSEGIIFTVNGQTHGHFPDYFFNRKKVGMSYLQDSILVTCDCSAFSNRGREDLFINSRDRLRQDKDLYSSIENELENLISQHDGLKELRTKRRQQEISEKLSDSKPLAELLGESLKLHPALSALLMKGRKISNPFNLRNIGISQREYKGEKYPTYFRIIKPKKEEILTKKCPINKKFRVQFETDVVNDYFGRDDYQGTSCLKINGTDIGNVDINLWNGKATLNANLPSDVLVGEVLEFELNVTDETQTTPFINKFKIICTDKDTKKYEYDKDKNENNNDDKEKNKGTKNEGNTKRQDPEKLALPTIYQIRNNEWNKHNFDEYSGLKAIYNGEGGYTFYINMDNIYLHHEIKAQRNKEVKIIESQFEYGLVLIALSLIESYSDKSQKEDFDIEKHVKTVTKALSPVIIPIIDTLGNIEINK